MTEKPLKQRGFDLNQFVKFLPFILPIIGLILMATIYALVFIWGVSPGPNPGRERYLKRQAEDRCVHLCRIKPKKCVPCWIALGYEASENVRK